MSKTFSFPKPETTNTERSWEQRWTKKFGQWQKPITVPAQMIQDLGPVLRPVQKLAMDEAAGIVDLPSVPPADLSQWIPADYAELETRTLAQDAVLTGPRLDTKSAAKMLIDWEKSMGQIARDYTIEMRKVSMSSYAQAYAGSFSGKRETKPLEKPAPREGTSVSSSYLHSVYDPEAFQRTVDITAELMRPHLADFDAIVFRGSSGAALAYPVAYLLKKPLVHVRKELGHSYAKVEGLYGAKRIAIVDDFVASGSTLRTIMQEVVAGYAERGYAPLVLTHLFLYAERCSSSEGAVRGAVGEILDGCEIHLAYDA